VEFAGRGVFWRFDFANADNTRRVEESGGAGFQPANRRPKRRLFDGRPRYLAWMNRAKSTIFCAVAGLIGYIAPVGWSDSGPHLSASSDCRRPPEWEASLHSPQPFPIAP
jgi:hypothetical protein